MKLAVLTRREEPFSFRNYRQHVLDGLPADEVQSVAFAPDESVPSHCDLVWDPGLGMAKLPAVLTRWARGVGAPVIGTMHGVRAFSLPAREISQGLVERAQLEIAKLRRLREWREFGPHVARIVAVSRFGAEEVQRAFGLPAARVVPIHHGVDHDVYRPDGERMVRERPYLLHVSSYQRKKNLERVLNAHQGLPETERPDLVLVVPGHPGGWPERRGVEWITRALDSQQLARWYRGAQAFVFPSLHETFGMPILEAMACGCPVLTANTTACPEVAGDAALLVDPRSTDALGEALGRLTEDDALREDLRGRGLERAAGFGWDRTAALHLELFRAVVGERR
ncbi:glycosyltransferase family 4 protein [Myxococcota bacterium]|nr:glycosyltransferase family 4 protein [Myxococcota bacterium]